ARKRRLAFVTPLPPERTGIADYAAQLLPALLPYFDIELVLQQSELNVAPALAALPRRSVDWFRAHAHEYEQILYQFGNSPFHSHMFDLLQAHPGVVVLHDFFLSSVLAYEQMTGGLPGIWQQALLHGHGPAALQAALADEDGAKDRYPCNLAVLEGATRVIVHSAHARALAAQWYGPAAAHNWSVVPLPRSAPLQGQRGAARAALGIAADGFLVCSFGFLAPTKHSLELLQAWLASALHQDARCTLVFVGANHGGDYGAQMSAAIRAAGAGQRIRIAGWTDEADYQRYLQAADVGVQLRAISRGETSAAVLDCLNYGLPTIVNANGSMADLPADTVYRLAERFSQAELASALERLHADGAHRATLGAAGAALLQREHSPTHCAALYRDALDQALLDAPQRRPALYAQLAQEADAPPDEAQLQQLARAVARAPNALAPRQLLVDVTAIAQHDLHTGIERVVRTQLLELLRLERPGLRVEPVYLSEAQGRWHYRYARQYAGRLLGVPDGVLGEDSLLDLQAGDVFYSADYSPSAVLAAAQGGVYARLRARGVAVNFLVHDLLPVLRPEFFPPRADLTHGAWLACIAAEADRLLCISGAVRDELAGWLAQQADAAPRAPELAVLHHGADILAPQAPAQPNAADAALLAQLGSAPCFLMVGTIEPRKGHLQTLAAFDLLWAAGVPVHLVIVGNEGWRPLPAAERRTIPRIVERLEQHPELGRRLFWLRGVDDALLQRIYQASACLLAPSEGEGFGLPLIEGARFGLPLLVRDLPVFREVAGTAAYYFSGLEGADLAQALRAWLALHQQAAHPAAALEWISWRDNVLRLLALINGQQCPAM
ncbi:glycosyltransferase, partial [Massilia sp. BJB1822]|uniref:glycosyltransferase n=1 Tax=Massilia sp. BJB1822 TaxID=2744470 RepID=UPI001593E5BB